MAFVDGVLGPLAEARIPLTDRGFLWGDHVFEVMRAVAGRPLDGDGHLDRLLASAALCRLPALDRAAIAGALAATLAAAALDDASVRVVVTRGDGGGLAPSPAARPRLVVTVEPLAPVASAGVRLHAIDGHRGGLVPAAAKAGSYLGSVLALAVAREAGADDALLHDGERVLETATAAILIVRAGVLHLPVGPLLPGVTAARVATLLARRGRSVAVGPLDRAALAAADEVLVASARRGVAPVIAIDDRAWPVGPCATEAALAYAAWVETVRAGGPGVPLARFAPPGEDANRQRGL